MTAIEPVGSPLWWIQRLEKQLIGRQGDVKLLTDYYEGNHPLPLAHEKVREKFRRMLTKARANWVALVVDAVAERLHVEGFRFDSADADADAWDIWQRNELDAESDLVHNDALIVGETYVTVWNDPEDPETPLISPEHASQMIHEYDPARRRRLAAALKLWCDDWTNENHATLYLPDGIYKYKAKKTGAPWTERAEKLDNPLGAVPVAVFRNRPRLLGTGRSEIGDLLDIQDRINKTIFDMMMASEYTAYRQRYSIGLEIPRDDDGNPRPPFEAAVDRLWMAEDPEVKFGEFAATDLEPYLKAIESDVNAMAAISRTPPHYLLGAMINISGDALKAAESGLSSKATARARQFGEAWEDVMRLAFGVLDDPRAKVADSQTIWADVETRTEGELVDALVKMSGLGVPNVALWERWGATPQEIDRWKDAQFEEALTNAAVNVNETTPPPVAPAAAAFTGPPEE